MAAGALRMMIISHDERDFGIYGDAAMAERLKKVEVFLQDFFFFIFHFFVLFSFKIMLYCLLRLTYVIYTDAKKSSLLYSFFFLLL